MIPLFESSLFLNKCLEAPLDHWYIILEYLNTIFRVISHIFYVSAANYLSNKYELSGILNLLALTEKHVLHHADLLSLLLVAICLLVVSDVLVRLGNDGDQQIQHDNNVEQWAQEEHEPIDFSVVFQVITATTQGNVKRVLPSHNISSEELKVPWCIRINWNLFGFSSQDHDLVNRQESICEGYNSNRQDDQESSHVKNASHDHSDQPAEFLDSS